MGANNGSDCGLTATGGRCRNIRLEAGRASCYIADSVLPTHGSTVCHFHFQTCEDGGGINVNKHEKHFIHRAEQIKRLNLKHQMIVSQNTKQSTLTI